MAEQFWESPDRIHHSDTTGGDILPPRSVSDPEHDSSAEISYSEEYLAAQKIIEDGIKKSIENGKIDLKVDFWVADDSRKDGGYMRHISLGQFLAGAMPKMVKDSEEYHELLDTYIGRSEDYAKSIGHKFGAPAMQVYESGGKTYVDGKSAAAGDER